MPFVNGRLSIPNIRYLKAVCNQDDLKLSSVASCKARTNKMVEYTDLMLAAYRSYANKRDDAARRRYYIIRYLYVDSVNEWVRAFFYVNLAQLVEHLIVNQVVAGSSPAGYVSPRYMQGESGSMVLVHEAEPVSNRNLKSSGPW